METSENEVMLPPLVLPWQCAWCVAERGEMPMKGTTHGICRRHLREWRKTMYAYREWKGNAYLRPIR